MMVAPQTDWYNIDDASVPDTPALVVYPDRVAHNINLLKTLVTDVARLRPHVKTHKCAEAALLNIDAGINKFKCATIAEAEMLGLAGAVDVLLAYQPVGPKLGRFIQVLKNYPATAFSCLVDNYAAADKMVREAVKHEIVISVYIDLNVGMNRTGIAADDAFKLFEYCSRQQRLKVLGLHAYDGHIHDADIDIRKQRVAESFAPVKTLLNVLKDGGYHPTVIAGGTPTMPIHNQWPDAECSPGTYIYWDWNYQQSYAEQAFLPAALLITRVISLPDETKICADLGHKSVSAENSLDKRVTFLNAPNLTPVSQSEEHLVLEAGAGHQFKPGDVLYGLPYHICPSVALYERAYIIANGRVSSEWKTIARDRKINF